MRILPFLITSLLVLPSLLLAQADAWQQRVSVQMEVDLDVKTHEYQGTQRLILQNNSPDTLFKAFFHLYFNAFQKDSEMAAWTRRLPDPDGRIANQLLDIAPEDEGYLHVTSLHQVGESVMMEENGTILEVTLRSPIPPGQGTLFDMKFTGRVPLQIRRSGRNNAEGIDYSMAQWYPKLCNYDRQGWHANPYIQREFYGVWGDYDVTIHIDPRYVIGATGYLQNPQSVGAGYEDPAKPLTIPSGDRKTWHFLAPNVHDFVWGADPDYKHVTRTMHDGTVFHFLYEETEKNKAAWDALPGYVDTGLYHINRFLGAYPYKQYSVIQGGDGGMEYPMATLITGNRPLRSLVGVTIHELVHSWYQMILGTNEALYPWMDEGFTSYATNEIMALLFDNRDPLTIHRGSYRGYYGLARSGVEEPMTTHADHYRSNFAYGNAAYSKGAVFLHQLGYVIGKEALEKALLDYYYHWRFKHPTPNDFIRIAEKAGDLELDWYKEYWIQTTKQIDYALDTCFMDGSDLVVQLRQVGAMPMPVDLAVRDGAGTVTRVTIPLDIMRGSKQSDRLFPLDYVAPDWPWAVETYTLRIPNVSTDGDVEVVIDPTQRMADVDLTNNRITLSEED